MSLNNKIKFAMAGAILIPCFAHLNLYIAARCQYGLCGYFIPLFVGGLAGFLIGLMKDKWVKLNKNLESIVEDRTRYLNEKINEPRQTEEMLKKSEKRFRDITNNALEWIWEVDDSGKFIYSSSAVEQIIGYTHEEILGKHFYDLFQPEEREKLKNATFEMFSQRQPFLKFINRCVHKNGQTVWLSTNGVPIIDEKGDFLGYRGADANITDHKLAEGALWESEERYRLSLEASPDSIIVYDVEGRTLYVNTSFEQTFGWLKDEILGSRINFVPQENLPETKAEIKRILKGEKILSFETRRLTKDGRLLDVQMSAALFEDQEGKPFGNIVILRDITEKKKFEAQLRQAQKMDAVGTLTGGIAHDFNNILQIIISYTELLLAKNDPGDPDYEIIKLIEQSSLRAADLIEQLLVFSRKVESKLKPVVLNKEIIKVSKLLERTIPKMITIECNLSQDLKIINADPLQIEQILMNLGINAKDAMPDGGRLIFETENITFDEEYCKTHLGSSPGEYVLLSVSDTGHGINKKTLERIFEPFYTTKEIGKGTGLGLAIVYGIVKSHSGYIMCYSESGLGTTFKLYLPVLIIESAEQRAKPGAKPLPGGSETILLVDDDADILKAGKAMLESYGYTAIMAESGERAIEIYEKEKKLIDLVILDVSMSGIGGHKCFEHLLKIDPGIKVIIISGYAASGKVKKTLESGAAGFIAKPFLRADMLKRVKETLDKK